MMSRANPPQGWRCRSDRAAGIPGSHLGFGNGTVPLPPNPIHPRRLRRSRWRVYRARSAGARSLLSLGATPTAATAATAALPSPLPANGTHQPQLPPPVATGHRGHRRAGDVSRSGRPADRPGQRPGPGRHRATRTSRSRGRGCPRPWPTWVQPGPSGCPLSSSGRPTIARMGRSRRSTARSRM